MINSTFQRQILFLLVSTLILTCDSLSFWRHIFISRWQQQNSQDKGRLRHSCLVSPKQVCAPPGIRLQRQKMSPQLLWKTKEVAHPKHLNPAKSFHLYTCFRQYSVYFLFHSPCSRNSAGYPASWISRESFPWCPQLTIHMQTLFIWASQRLSDCG